MSTSGGLVATTQPRGGLTLSIGVATPPSEALPGARHCLSFAEIPVFGVPAETFRIPFVFRKKPAIVARMTRRSRHEMAYAVADIEDARDELRTVALPALTEGPVTASALRERLAVGSRAVEDALERLADVQARLTQEVAAAGVPVSEAARYLDVSEPTIRDWVARGLLEPVPDAKPVLLEVVGMRRVERGLRELRERGQDRDWTRALVHLLHDRAELARPEIVAGLDELRRGTLEPA